MEFRDRVRLDRYAIKDMDAKLQVDDLVVASLTRIFEREDREVETREVCNVTSCHADGTFDILLPDGIEETGMRRHRLEYVVEKTYPEICQRVALAVSPGKGKLEIKFRQQVREAMVAERFVPGGRILAGLGRPDHDLTLYNCFVFAIPGDSRRAIMDHGYRILDTYSRGGGCGWNQSILRPRGSPVRKINGRSSGSVTWAELDSVITGIVEQGGSRQGAAMIGLEPWHPDIIEFVEAKSQTTSFVLEGRTVEYNKGLLENANVSVFITDDFMEAVENDTDWDLIFPDTRFPGYDELWDGDIAAWKAADRPVDTYRTIRALDLWNKIIEHAWASGEPGIFFMGRARAASNSHYYAQVIGTNPCVTGNTLVHTQTGLVTVTEAMEKHQGSLDMTQDRRMLDIDTALSSGGFFPTGTKEVFRVQTAEGYRLDCTEDHRVMTPEGWTHICDLQPGDYVHVLSRGEWDVERGTYCDTDMGHLLGWLLTDGHVTGDKAVLNFYGEKRKLAQTYADRVNRIVDGTQKAHRDYVIAPVAVPETDRETVTSTRLYRMLTENGLDMDRLKERVPYPIRVGDEQTQRAFLRAAFAADGTVAINYVKGSSVRLCSTEIGFLEDVQLMLLDFGVASKIYKNRHEAGERLLPDGNGGMAYYMCKATHDLTISKANIIRFAGAVGIEMERKQALAESFEKGLKRRPNRERFLARVESVTPLGEQPVFDITVPGSHAYASNGLISHNCAEEVLPANGVCNLGHINLARYVDPDTLYPEQERSADDALGLFDWKLFTKDVHMGVRFLDRVIDLNQYHDDAIREQQMKERRVGLGFMGYGDVLIKLGLRYGSPEALKFTDTLLERFSTQSYLASVTLAKELESFPAFDADPFLASGFMRTQTEEVRSAVKAFGIRNVTVNTIAPTGTVSVLAQTTSGCEPLIEIDVTSVTRIGIVQETAAVGEAIREKFGTDRESWPAYVVTAMRGITPEEHVCTQATMQRWIDAAISKTVNLPEDATVQDVSDTYRLVWERGCKGATVYRDGSRSKQVYYVDESAPPQELEVVEATSSGAAVRERPDVGIAALFSTKGPIGTAHVAIRHDENGDPVDVFVSTGKGNAAADAEGYGRLMSLILKLNNGAYVSQQQRLELIRAQLDGIVGPDQYGIGPMAPRSLPDTIAKVLARYLAGDYEMASIPFGKPQVEELRNRVMQLRNDPDALMELFDKLPLPHSPPEDDEADPLKQIRGSTMANYPRDYCPQCNHYTFLQIPGKCPHCTNCGYSRC